MRRTDVPVVAVVGRPNVGKSSLVNRIIGRREAIVEETAGVTRDRRGFSADWRGRPFEIVDTGGLEAGARGLEARVAEQARVAIEAADVIMLVVDATTGPLEDDRRVAAELRRSGKPVLLVANKVDADAQELSAADFYGLGLGKPVTVSALHGRGSGDLLDELVLRLPETSGGPSEDWAAAAIVGRPNVGKSSLLNALLGEHRAIVHDAPGTTRDPVDSVIRLEGDRTLRIVDTAGMRRRVKLQDPLEYYSWLRSGSTLERADVAIQVVDISEGVTALDQRIGEHIGESGRACVVVLNKWDLLEGDEADLRRLEDDVKTKLRFMSWAVIVRTSAVRGRGVTRILPAVEAAVMSHRLRLPTAEVNRIVAAAQERRPPARVGGHAVRILYAVQAGVSPPTFVLFTSRPLQPAYLAYLENEIRKTQPFQGTPVHLRVRVRSRDKVEGRG